MSPAAKSQLPNGLNLSQYQGKHLKNVHRTKSGKYQDFFLDRPVREALDRYIEIERGGHPGPLFLSKSGKRLNQSDVYVALQRIAAHASATLPADKQIRIHPHLLRHTFLRRVTDKEDIRAAREVSGLKSDKYLWRYTKLTGEQVERAVTGLYDDLPDSATPAAVKLEQPSRSRKVLKVELSLVVENNSNSVRGKGKSTREIEDRILSRFHMVKPEKSDSKYLLEIRYDDEAEIDDIIANQILAPAERIAASRNGFLRESGVLALDGSKRRWG